MTDALAPHRFNTDLLSDPRDRDEAKRAYPKVFDLLYDEGLLAQFNEYDRPANRAKRRSRMSGVIAVGLAGVGLWGASAKPLFYSSLPVRVAEGAGIAFGVLSLLAVAVGLGGVRTARSKRQWLHNRLMGERLRQFHFQTFVCQIDAINDALAGKADWSNFSKERGTWLSRFILRFRGQVDSEFAAILNYEEEPLWLHPPPRIEEIAAKVPASQLPREFFDSYRELRIRRQLQLVDTNRAYPVHTYRHKV